LNNAVFRVLSVTVHGITLLSLYYRQKFQIGKGYKVLTKFSAGTQSISN